MRRVLISDPHPGVRRMVVRMVARLGYEPIAVESRPTPAQLRSADVLLVEPAAADGLTLAHTARVANPTLAIIGEGAMAPEQADLWKATVGPVGHLAKPFTSEQLDAALQQGFAYHDSTSQRGTRVADRRALRAQRGNAPARLGLGRLDTAGR